VRRSVVLPAGSCPASTGAGSGGCAACVADAAADVGLTRSPSMGVWLRRLCGDPVAGAARCHHSVDTLLLGCHIAGCCAV